MKNSEKTQANIRVDIQIHWLGLKIEFRIKWRKKPN